LCHPTFPRSSARVRRGSEAASPPPNSGDRAGETLGGTASPPVRVACVRRVAVWPRARASMRDDGLKFSGERLCLARGARRGFRREVFARIPTSLGAFHPACAHETGDRTR
jgi:hypothetical protein